MSLGEREAGDGRARQRRRTRALLLRAAAELVDAGTVPTVEQAAAAADVSPATGYRYFSSQAALVQALVEESMPAWDEHPLEDDDVLARVDAALSKGAPRLLNQEMLHRAALRLSLDPSTQPAVRRGGRRRAVEEILAPVRDRLDPDTLRRTEAALGMVLGIESVVALRDVFDVPREEIEGVWRLACRAIVRAALEEGR
jgi:AcrR family transcriptional regulator